jgi:hypothetical protein
MNPSQLHMVAHIVGVPIAGLSVEKIAEIMVSLQAQRKTAKYKKAVYLVEDLVFKGPYNSHDSALMKNLRVSYALELLETALQLHERERGSLPWQLLGYAGGNSFYLVAPNVGKWKDIPFDVISSKLETNVKVVRRGEAVQRVSDIEETERLTEDIKSATLQHLYLRFLLDIGDSGTHNVLIREDYHRTGRLIAGIDLEETRSFKKKERRLDHLFKKGPSKNQICLYDSGVGKIKSLSFNRLDQHASEGLRAVGVDLERLKGNMELWERLE